MKRLIVLFVPFLAASCGFGTAGAVGAASGGGSGNAAASIGGFRVEGSKTPPAKLRFVLTDREADAARVELFYALPGGPLVPMTGLQGLPGNPALLETSPAGFDHEVEWSFPDEAGLPADASFRPGITVFASLDGSLEMIPGANSTELGMGNDPPEILSAEPPAAAEVTGIVPIRLAVADSSADVVSIRAEYQLEGDAPDAWTPARPGGLNPSDPTPDLAFDSIGTAPDPGVGLVFFWDTDFDLGTSHDGVARLRFQAEDSAVAGDLAVTPDFRVDNNAEPISIIREGAWLANSDDRRGVPIPYRVIDHEGDEVDLVFQWRRVSETFPQLPTDPDEIRTILDDPAERERLQICTEFPTYAKGRLVPIDETHVRLPELASSEAWILARGIIGAELEILRPSSILEPIGAQTKGWDLLGPVAALPVGDGLNALVLDEPVPGRWRLREIALATGGEVREVATAPTGSPSAMAYEPGEDSVVIASDVDGDWHIERIELEKSHVVPLVGVTNRTEHGRVRGIAPLSPCTAVATVGSSVVYLRYAGLPNTVHEMNPAKVGRPGASTGRDPFTDSMLGSRAVPILEGLHVPWGIVVDPLAPHRVLVAERDAPTMKGLGRILSFDLRTRTVAPIVALDENNCPGIPQPTSIALEQGGTRLLAATDENPTDGHQELRTIDLGARGGNRAVVVAETLPATIMSVSGGLDGLRILALGSENDLAVAGGIEQRRRIEDHNEDHQVELGKALAPPARSFQPWRIRRGAARPQVEGEGAFVWDTRGIASTVRKGVHLRMLALDDEAGMSIDTELPKELGAPYQDSPSIKLEDSVLAFPSSVTAADLDGDGDPDLASTKGSQLAIHFQTEPGDFDPTPLLLGNSTFFLSITAADIDEDQDMDIVSAESDGLEVFFQAEPGTFQPDPLRLGDTISTFEPFSVAATDLDGDRDIDLVAANPAFQNVAIFFQTTKGFDPEPLLLGDSSTTTAPLAATPADLDCDGDLDIVVANFDRLHLAVFFQTSPGIFAPYPLLLGDSAAINRARSVTAADLDGDGDTDLAAADEDSNNIVVYLQTAPGSFEDSFLIGDSATTRQPRSITAADLDNDGDIDLASANGASDNIGVFFQVTPGVFAPSPLQLGDPSAIDNPYAVAATDLDGDGRLDLISANPSSSSVSIFYQIQPGRFQQPHLFGDLTRFDGPQSVVSSDIDGDGNNDIVSANGTSNNLGIFFQTSPGAFEALPALIQNPNEAVFPVSVASADFDKDGSMDIACANQSSHNLAVFFQSGLGSFPSIPLLIGNPSITGSPQSIAGADLDGDGDTDLVSSVSSFENLAADIAIFFQTEPGVFDNVPVLLGDRDTIRRARSISTADLDGDGDLDLASANEFSDNIAVFFQTAPGSFGSEPLLLGGSTATDAPTSVASGDLDYDGDIDLASTNGLSNNLTIFTQVTPGVFDPVPLFLGSSHIRRPESIALGDVDGDGDIDLISSNFASDNVTIFLQTLLGRFDPTPIVIGNSILTGTPREVRAMDIDGDGDTDLVIANESSDSLTIFWGGR